MSETHEHAAYLSPSSLKIPRYMPLSAWTEHAAFAFWLIEALAPRSVVELGVHHGYSYFAFCQAVHELGLPTACYGVDTWQGDEHSDFYDDSVWTSVNEINRPYQRFSKLMRMTFEEALSSFPDKSIDLIHIDGRHFYEDVKSDFESWLPKMSDSGIVLLHDTMVRERDFGVWRFLEELETRYQVFNFAHCNGLGVVAIGTIPPGLKVLFETSQATKDSIRSTYTRLGEGLSLNKIGETLTSLHRHIDPEASAGCQKSIKTRDLAELSQVLGALDDAVTRLVNSNRNKKTELVTRMEELINLVGQCKRQTPSSRFPRFLQRHSPFSWTTAYKSLRSDYEVLSRSPLFDPAWYRRTYKNVEEKGEDPLYHFMKFGNTYSLSPGPYFDTRAYFEQHPEAKTSGENPLLHYIRMRDHKDT